MIHGTEIETVTSICTGCCENCKNKKVKSLPVRLDKDVKK